MHLHLRGFRLKAEIHYPLSNAEGIHFHDHQYIILEIIAGIKICRSAFVGARTMRPVRIYTSRTVCDQIRSRFLAGSSIDANRFALFVNVHISNNFYSMWIYVKPISLFRVSLATTKLLRINDK